MQNELNERQSKRTLVGGGEEGREGREVESPNRKQRKIVAIYATNRKRCKLQDENEGRKVYAKQQTKQSRQLICWQRKGESSCPNIYCIYKAGHREHAGHTHSVEHTGHWTQDTGHGTWANNFVLVGKENLRAKRQVAGQTAWEKAGGARG